MRQAAEDNDGKLKSLIASIQAFAKDVIEPMGLYEADVRLEIKDRIGQLDKFVSQIFIFLPAC